MPGESRPSGRVAASTAPVPPAVAGRPVDPWDREPRRRGLRGHRQHLGRDFLIGSASAATVAVVLLAGIFAGPLLERWLGVGKPPGGPVFVGAPNATIDQQLSLALTASSSNLSYTVSAVAQADPNGYGPAYLVNGLTVEGYWYQVGIAFDWVAGALDGYLQGFVFLDEVWTPTHELATGSVVPLSIVSGDSVQLSLVVNGSQVSMSASDLDTGATHGASYPSLGASAFEGLSSVTESEGAFSGAMTEWYHSGRYNGSVQPVSYRPSAPFAGSVILALDEGNVTNNSTVFFVSEKVVPSCDCVMPYAYGGLEEDVASTEFETGVGF